MWCKNLSKTILMGLALSACLVAARPSANNTDRPGNETPATKTPAKVLRFLAPWTNTNAIAYVNGDSIGVMTAVDKYCGWYETKISKPDGEFSVYFKQTVGNKFYSAEGVVSKAPGTENEISLDSLAAEATPSGFAPIRQTHPPSLSNTQASWEIAPPENSPS